MSRADKQTTRVVYDVTVDHNTSLPTRIEMKMITSVRKGGENKEGDRLIFTFQYELKDFDQLARVEVPVGARKLLK
ncbi:MAG: hypothetical protein AB7O52_11125 [Planctomycetota bacterium]